MIDMDLRDEKRGIAAIELIKEMNLLPTAPNVIKESGLERKESDSNNNITKHNINKLVHAFKIETDSCDRLRCVGQLWGEVTYEQSHKDLALNETIEKEKKLLEVIRSIGVPKKKKKKSALKGDDKKYYDSCSLDTEFVSKGIYVREKAQQTAYDFDLQQVQNADPHNWEITSKNRQRALYGHLYEEYDKGGQTGYDVMGKLCLLSLCIYISKLSMSIILTISFSLSLIHSLSHTHL